LGCGFHFLSWPVSVPMNIGAGIRREQGTVGKGFVGATMFV